MRSIADFVLVIAILFGAHAARPERRNLRFRSATAGSPGSPSISLQSFSQVGQQLESTDQSQDRRNDAVAGAGGTHVVQSDAGEKNSSRASTSPHRLLLSGSNSSILLSASLEQVAADLNQVVADVNQSLQLSALRPRASLLASAPPSKASQYLVDVSDALSSSISSVEEKTIPALESLALATPDARFALVDSTPPADSRARAPHMVGAQSHRTVRPVLLVLLLLFLSFLFALLLLMWQPQRPLDGDSKEVVKNWVESLPVMAPDVVDRTFQVRSSYDCLINQPQAPAAIVRLEGIAMALQRNADLFQAPLTQRPSLLFASSASETRLDGVRAPPVAFDSACATEFEVELRCDGACSARRGAPGLQSPRVRIRGNDVALFGMVDGSLREQAILGHAREPFRDFVRARRCAAGSFPGSAALLEFQESVLVAGAHVTCVGEVRRMETGELRLLPLEGSAINAVGIASRSQKGRLCPLYSCGEDAEDGPELHSERTSGLSMGLGLTSWERGLVEDARVGRVLISDDPKLLGAASFGFCCGRGR